MRQTHKINNLILLACLVSWMKDTKTNKHNNLRNLINLSTLTNGQNVCLLKIVSHTVFLIGKCCPLNLAILYYCSSASGSQWSQGCQPTHSKPFYLLLPLAVSHMSSHYLSVPNYLLGVFQVCLHFSCSLTSREIHSSYTIDEFLHHVPFPVPPSFPPHFDSLELV